MQYNIQGYLGLSALYLSTTPYGIKPNETNQIAFKAWILKLEIAAKSQIRK